MISIRRFKRPLDYDLSGRNGGGGGGGGSKKGDGGQGKDKKPSSTKPSNVSDGNPNSEPIKRDEWGETYWANTDVGKITALVYGRMGKDDKGRDLYGGGMDLSLNSSEANGFDLYNVIQTINSDAPGVDFDTRAQLSKDDYPRNDCKAANMPFYYDPNLSSNIYDNFSSQNTEQFYYHDLPYRLESSYSVQIEATIMGRFNNNWMPISTIKWGYSYQNGNYIQGNVEMNASPTFTHYMLSLWKGYR